MKSVLLPFAALDVPPVCTADSRFDISFDVARSPGCTRVVREMCDAAILIITFPLPKHTHLGTNHFRNISVNLSRFARSSHRPRQRTHGIFFRLEGRPVRESLSPSLEGFHLASAVVFEICPPSSRAPISVSPVAILNFIFKTSYRELYNLSVAKASSRRRLDRGG